MIRETGLCVWRSGQQPVLDFKVNGDFLRGCMALLWTGAPHHTPSNTELCRDYAAVEEAGRLARQAVLPGQESLAALAAAVDASYRVQLGEGMAPLPEHVGALAKKYCGGGWGGYALYLWQDAAARDAFVEQRGGGSDALAMAIEPYVGDHSH